MTVQDVSLRATARFHVHGQVTSAPAILATAGTIIVPTKFNPLSFRR
jgi:hypothetical protein